MPGSSEERCRAPLMSSGWGAHLSVRSSGCPGGVLVQIVGMAGRLEMGGDVSEPADDEDHHANGSECWKADDLGADAF